MRAPGGEEITTLEVLGQMEAVEENITVAICPIFSTSVTVDPGSLESNSVYGSTVVTRGFLSRTRTPQPVSQDTITQSLQSTHRVPTEYLQSTYSLYLLCSADTPMLRYAPLVATNFVYRALLESTWP